MHASFVWAKEWDPRLLEASRLAYQNNTAQAEKVIESYIQEHPLDPNGFFIQAVVLDWKALFTDENIRAANQKILAVYKKASDMAFHLWEIDPKNVDRLIDLGNSYLFLGRKQAEMGDWFKAVLTSKKSQKHFEEALERDPSRNDAYMAFGTFHYLADNTPSGAAPFKGLLGIKGTKAQGLAELKKSMTPTHPYYYDAQYVWMFLQMEYEKNYPEALRMEAELEKSFPKNPELRRKRAQIIDRQDKAQGLQEHLAFVQWCESQGGGCTRNYLFLAYFDLGHLSQALGQKEAAREFFGKASELDLKLDPSLSAKTLYFLGQIEQSDGKIEAAIDKYFAAKSTAGLPKSLKKEIEKSLKEVCEVSRVPEKC
jgi:tetratricopeptide (TPR) repeat protein